VLRADAAKVRACQPFGHDPRKRARHALVLLKAINDGDKHRTIQPVWAFPETVGVKVTSTQDCVVPERPPSQGEGQPLQVGQELTFLRARKLGPDPRLDVRLTVTPEPVLPNRLGARAWDRSTGTLVYDLLGEFSDLPDSVHEVGAELVAQP
jgi:hypothetical protein